MVQWKTTHGVMELRYAIVHLTDALITAIDVLSNSSIANTNNTINFNEYINELISINATYQRSIHLFPFVCAVVNV